MTYQNKALLVVALTIFVDSFIGGVIVPVLPLYAEVMGLSSFQTGIVFAVYSAAVLVLSIPLGVMSDRWGRKKVMVGGMVGLTLSTVAFIFAQSFWALTLIRLLQGTAAAATWMVGPALLADMFPPRERGGKMGLAMMGNSFGFLFGPVVGGFLYDWGGYAAPFILSAVVTVLVLWLTIWVIREPQSRHTVAAPQPERGHLSLLLGNRVLTVGCGVMLLASMGFGFIDPLLPAYFAERFGATSTTIGWLFAAMSVTTLVAHPLFGRLSDLVGRVAPIGMGLMSTAAAFALFTRASSVAWCFLAMAVLGITYSLTTAPIAPLLADAINQKQGSAGYGTAIGFNNTAWSIGYTVGPLVGGAFVDLWGLPNLFVVYAVLLLGYLPVFFTGTKGFALPPAVEKEG